ncbi:SDR family NAD(P)-dependent oxidoreductase [Jeongeupia naejangsanensis]|uniref:SDR family NAD(P)-dependent oxidoreductase n=1 Tax=Jeongeupia naejangsanensis TaxID=613195 RepID=A0ABS2BGT0_9NEIS|nr:SDR family NAD(P)-dependent oxidoreductase [Jeongeupia naejangsanensis]MBM3114308.1 SDR family NAD(P)-dependent oxidoreductase [Jeongeupia naejangsanensis]
MSSSITQSPRSILISGCSTGIGHSVAHGLAARGWRVFATARQADDVASLSAEGLNALQLDVSDDTSIRQCVDKVLTQTGGRLDALFNNAGFGVPGAVEDLGREAMRFQFETNVFGSLALTNAVLPVMRRQGRGRILFNSSVLGFAAMPYRGAYNASKFALEGLVDTLRLELEGSDIHAALIEPGPITSRFRANAQLQFDRWIDDASSVHQPAYRAMRERLAKPGPAAPFTLPPEAVLAAVIAALDADRPAARYRVTVPTHLFWWLKHLLPTRLLDLVLLRASGDEPGHVYGRK